MNATPIFVLHLLELYTLLGLGFGAISHAWSFNSARTLERRHNILSLCATRRTCLEYVEQERGMFDFVPLNRRAIFVLGWYSVNTL